jgi:Flp pilus assembly protein TadG
MYRERHRRSLLICVGQSGSGRSLVPGKAGDQMEAGGAMRRGEPKMRSRDERGAVAVEFAILVPLLVVILFGITAVGIALFRMVNYTSAAREGARYAAVHCRPEAATCTTDLIAARVTQAANGNPIGPGSPTADLDCSVAPGEPVTVSWEQTVPIQIPLLPDLSFTRTIAGTFRCE